MLTIWPNRLHKLLLALKVFWQKYFSIFINIVVKREDIKIRCQNPEICLTFIIWKHIFVFINTLIVFYLQHNKCFGVKSTQIFLLFGTHLFRDIGHSFNVFIICTYFQEWRGQKQQFPKYNLLNIRWVSKYFVSLIKFEFHWMDDFSLRL